MPTFVLHSQMTLETIDQLAAYFSCRNLSDLGEYFNQTTDCGAHVSFLVDGVMLSTEAFHIDAKPEWESSKIEGIQFRTTVVSLGLEKSEVMGETLLFPFSEAELDREIEYIEAEADMLENGE